MVTPSILEGTTHELHIVSDLSKPVQMQRRSCSLADKTILRTTISTTASNLIEMAVSTKQRV
eukprot:2410802-Amphidinium_carterae.1